MEENFIGYRASYIQKIFGKWSHGTFYNRVVSLGLKDNEKYMRKNDVSGTVLYNREAIDLLAKQYLEENSNFISADELSVIIDNALRSNLSKPYAVKNTADKENKTDKIEKVEKVEKVESKKEEVNSVKASTISYDEAFLEKYMLRAEHNEIVKHLKEEIEFLRKDIDKTREVEKIREQRDTIVEQQKLEKMVQDRQNNEIKLLAQDEEHSRKGVFFRLREFFSKK